MSAPINSIKNFFLGGMDQDSAPERIVDNDFIVSFNCRQSGTSAGEDGYTTNIESTMLIPGTRSGGINRCIGSQGFEQIRAGIAFIYNSANFHQIVELNFDTGVQTVVFTNLTDSAGVNVLPLNPQYYVDDIKLIAETFLAFNDAFNSPFFINYVRLKAGGYGTLTINDFLLIQRQPSKPITAVYSDDASRSVNLLVTNLFQFRSEYIGLDYEYSAWSTISERFIPTTENTPTVGTDVTKNNNLILSIDAGDNRVFELQVGARYANIDWFIIKTILRTDILLLPATIDISNQIYEAYNPSTNIYTLVFYNDGLYENVPVLETDQLYDTVPLVAGAMEVLNGNELVLGDISIGYPRPTTPVSVTATNYNPNLTVPTPPGYTPLTVAIINPGQSGSGLGNHKRLVTLEFFGLAKLNDFITITLVDISDASQTLVYQFNPVTSVQVDHTAGYTFSQAPLIPYSSSYIPTDGNLSGINIITPSLYKLQTATVTLFNAGSGEFKSIHGLKANSSYQAVLACYDGYGRPLPIETNAKFVVKTNSYGQSHGQTPQLNWQILNATAPVGAASYQWLLSENNTHQSSLYVLASLIDYIGEWNASTNTPTLAGGTGIVGQAYRIGAPSITQNLGNGVQNFNSGDFVVYNGTSWDIIAKELGDLSSATSYYFYLNALQQFNTKNSTSILAYDYTVNDRCTLCYYQTPGLTNPLNWFDGVANPIADVQVQGYNAGTQFLKVNTSSAISPATLAGKDVLIEIYTPKQRSQTDATGATVLSETAFFEIGTSYPIINGLYSVLSGTITQGDIYFKTREMGGSIDPNVLYTLLAEDFNFSDFYPSAYNSYGRPRTYSDTLETTEQVANMVYSETYIIGSKVNGLTKFYAENIYGEQGGQTSSNYGRIRKLIQINNELVCIQELDHGSIPVYINILEDQAEQQNVAISEKILGNIRYTKGKHIGIGNAKESVAVYNNVIYWIDPHRSEPIRWAGDGALPISGKMSKYLKSTLQAAYAKGLKIIGWYDIFNDEYVISIQQLGGVVTTFAFNSTNWQYQATYTVPPSGITITVNPTHGTASYDNTTGLVTVTPTLGYVGSDTLQFQFVVNGVTITKNACFNWTAGSSDVNPFTFAPLTGVPLSTLETSNIISVIGNTIAVAISITGGEYSINGGSWTSAAGTVNQYDTVQVRQTSSGSSLTETDSVLTIGTTSGTFSVTTGKSSVDTFAFTAQTGVPLSSVRTSNMITVSGNTIPAPISIVGGTYSKNGGAYVSTPGTVNAGDTITVRQTSSASQSTLTTATLTIDTQAQPFNVTTGTTVVSPFSFTPQAHQPLSTNIISNSITVTGNTLPAAISITGGSYSVNGGGFITGASTVNAGDTVRTQVLSSSSPGTNTSCTLTIDVQTGTFTVTTKVAVNVPYSLSEQVTPFADANLNITVNGILVKTVNNTETGSINALEGDVVIFTAFGELAPTGPNPKLHMKVTVDGSTYYENTIADNPPPTVSMDSTALTLATGHTYLCEVDSFTDPIYGNVAIVNEPYRRNDCTSGESGTTVPINIAANTYTSTISQADADAQAQAAAQDMANDPITGGSCLVDSTLSTLLIDYQTDTDADLCAYVKTTGLSESDILVTGTSEIPSGPLQLPNDGRNPATCFILSSDKLLSASPAWRFGINLAYFIQKYTGVLTSIDFEIRGRTITAHSVGGSYAARDISEGVLEFVGVPGQMLPAVTMGSSSPIGYSTNVTGGADGTVGLTVGSPILTLTYDFTTNAITAVTY